MKLLFVTPFLPSPPRFGGQRRLDGLMRNLAQRHELTVLSFNTDDEFGAPALEATRAYCREVVTFPDMELRQRRDKRLLQARSLVSRFSFEHLLLARRSEFLDQLQRLVDSGTFDIVQVEFAQLAAFRFRHTRARTYRTVLDEHNIEFDIVRRTADASGSVARRLYSAIDWRKLQREEQAAWRWFDGVSVTSERDARLLRTLEPASQLSVVSNGVDVDQFQPSTAPPEPESLLFFGAMNYYPNHDGIHYFIEQVWPHVLRKRPGARLRVVGPAPASVTALGSANVEVTGFVDAVEPYIDRASVVIVPLRLGGGTRLKIVEAMAKAKPIVSTRIGAEGIDVLHDEHALLADDPREFAEQVARVLASRELAARLGRAARELAIAQYGWPALVARLEAFYQELLARDARPCA